MTNRAGEGAATSTDAGSARGPVEAVLFDIDGTLVDTNYLHALAWRRGFADAGFDVPTAWIHHRIGMGGGRLMEELVGAEREDAKAAWQRHFDALKPEIRPFQGAAELLREVHGRSIQVVLASSSEEADLEALLAALGADDAIDCVTSAGDVGEAKPSPEIFEVAMEKAACNPERTIVVGDTVWDVAAARRAGLDCVCVLTGGIARSQLERAGALAVYRDAGELLARLDDSPLFAKGRRDGSESLDEIPGELRSRIEAATAHAQVRTIRQSGPQAFEVHALAGDRIVHMRLRLRPAGSVVEMTETFLRDQIVDVGRSDARTIIEVRTAAGHRSLTVPAELGEALTGPASRFAPGR
jgi:HAD superfamily hydrolase (TIGR01549 family)